MKKIDFSLGNSAHAPPSVIESETELKIRRDISWMFLDEKPREIHVHFVAGTINVHEYFNPTSLILTPDNVWIAILGTLTYSISFLSSTSSSSTSTPSSPSTSTTFPSSNSDWVKYLKLHYGNDSPIFSTTGPLERVISSLFFLGDRQNEGTSRTPRGAVSMEELEIIWMDGIEEDWKKLVSDVKEIGSLLDVGIVKMAQDLLRLYQGSGEFSLEVVRELLSGLFDRRFVTVKNDICTIKAGFVGYNYNAEIGAYKPVAGICIADQFNGPLREEDWLKLREDRKWLELEDEEKYLLETWDEYF